MIVSCALSSVRQVAHHSPTQLASYTARPLVHNIGNIGVYPQILFVNLLVLLNLFHSLCIENYSGIFSLGLHMIFYLWCCIFLLDFF